MGNKMNESDKDSEERTLLMMDDGAATASSKKEGKHPDQQMSDPGPSSTVVEPEPLPSEEAMRRHEIDPLVAAFYHNQTKSHLHRLPLAILIKITRHLDPCSFECLRRVSRKFARKDLADGAHEHLRHLKPDPDTSGSVPPNLPHGTTGPFVWRRPALISHFREDLIRLLDRDRYCHGCRSAREAPDWDQRVQYLRRYLHCSVCRADHPACLFPVSQRGDDYSGTRTCIGHQGHLGLCFHNSHGVKWAKIQRYLEDAVSDLESGRGSGHWLVLTCPEKSHGMKGANARASKGSFGRKGTKLKDHHKPKSTSCPAFVESPSLCLVLHNGVKETDQPVLKMSWSLHVDLTDEKKPLTRRVLSKRLTQARTLGGYYIFPQTARGPIPELRCFDPNLCNCIKLDGAQLVDWVRAPAGPDTCRRREDRRLIWLFGEAREEHAEKETTNHQLKLFWNRHPGETHTATSDFAAAHGGQEIGRCRVEISPCPHMLRCLEIHYTRYLELAPDIRSGTMGPQWFNSLDPESYGLSADNEGYGVYWCGDDECLNYYNYASVFTRFLARAEYQHECPRACH